MWRRPIRCAIHLCVLLLALYAWPPAMADGSDPQGSDRWDQTLGRVADSVVSLQLSQLRAFDDSPQGGSSATGFVVDAERGIVLTNRHVVGSGPLRVSATFQNQERVDAMPLYRDPIHDFGFIRYDPKALKYARPASLPLRPDKVRTGLDIRVIGSDGGEQLSILAGTIARLDREVPSYGRYGYNDFNTFYLQAASGTSGGSSGSPVIDMAGDVVALNAAANSQTAASFFLPLYRIQYALSHLQQDQPVPRGGFQTLFEHRPFRDLVRLGLTSDAEAQVRAERPQASGLLTVGQVIPGGVAAGKLLEGDILMSVNDTLIADYVTLEALLDAHIDTALKVQVLRQGEPQELAITPASLHALMPKRLLEIGDSVLQDMSIQHARAMHRAQQGVVVMEPGYAFSRAGVTEGSVIVEVEGKPVENLDQWILAVRTARPDSRLRMRLVVPGQEFTSRIAQVEIDDQWAGYRDCRRVDDARYWRCRKLVLPERVRSEPLTSAVIPGFRDALLNRVAPAMVRVDFAVPYSIDNVYARAFTGTGLVVDKQQGLVAVDRNTVPVALGDVELTFFGSRVVPAQVVFLHPRHNIALVKYDPSDLGEAAFKALELVSDSPEQALPLTLIGYRADGTFRRLAVDALSRQTLGYEPPRAPRFQQSTLDVYDLADAPASIGGPLVDARGAVHAFYVSFAHESGREIKQQEWAIPAAVISESLRMYRRQTPYYSIDARLSYRTLAEASEAGLPLAWLRRFNALAQDVRRVIQVDAVVPGTDAGTRLLPGDLIVAIDGTLVADVFEAEVLAQQPEMQLTVLRRAELLDIDIRPTARDVLGTQRVVSWAGALFQKPHPEIGFFQNIDVPGVYVGWTEQGSPALWDGLYRNRFVIAVDGTPVSNLGEFVAQIARRGQDEITRLTLVSMSGQRTIVPVQPEYNFWPTFEIRRTQAGWQRRAVAH